MIDVTPAARKRVTAAAAPRASLTPLDLMLPDAIACHVRRHVGVFEDNTPQRIKVVAIQLGLAQGLGPLLDEGVEIDVLLQIEKILPILGVEAEKLPAYGAQQLLQHRLDQRQQKPRIVLGHGQHETEIVA